MRPLFVLAFTLNILLSSAQAQPGFAIERLTGDYYIYTTWRPIGGIPFPANGMYIVTRQGIVFIDSPWDTAQALPLLDSIERRHHQKAIACIATHYHDDRTGALAIFEARGLKTYSSCQTLALCRGKNEPQAQYCFSADTVFDFGDHTVETFYPGRGHTADNIVAWCPDAKILYGGCLVKSCDAPGLGNLADADPTDWGHSIAAVKKQFPSPSYIIPGHGSWTGRKALAHSARLVNKYNAGKIK